MPHALRARLAFVLAAAVISGCEGADSPPSVPGTIRKGIIVRPGGSVVSVKYSKWVQYSKPGYWTDFTPTEPWPRFPKVETIVTTLANSVARLVRPGRGRSRDSDPVRPLSCYGRHLQLLAGADPALDRTLPATAAAARCAS